jgi:hypothetical protein
MSFFLLSMWAALDALQSVFLLLVWGIGLARFIKPPVSRCPPADSTPDYRKASLIIPLTGRSPEMEAALQSFLTQDYPFLETLLVTSGDADPARGLAEALSLQHERIRHVRTGAAARCAQKNHNLLAGIAAADRESEVFVFCDANHLARPDAVRELVAPILRGVAEFTTGYREVELHAFEPEGVALRLLVWSMGQFQALPAFTQPWGGAMAMSAAAFRNHRVADLWAASAVDDCSLAGLLAGKGVPVRYCPGALLRTPVRSTAPDHLLDWFTRQLLYPRFYTRAVWRLMGVILISALVLPAASLLLAIGASIGAVSPAVVPVAACHLSVPIGLGVWLRKRLCAGCPPAVWWAGFLKTLGVVYAAYWKTLGATAVVWRGVRYEVDGRGHVTRIDRDRLRSGAAWVPTQHPNPDIS